MEVVTYSVGKKEEWDSFVGTSKNSLFMFYRDYMEYHRDRFQDGSLMFYENEKLISVMPISVDGDTLSSHGGLTFGGFITDDSMKQHRMNEMVDCLLEYMRNNGYKKLIYKQIPHFYHNIPAEEDEYSLFWRNATPVKMECATVIDMENRIKLPKGRKAQISRAKREEVIVEESTDFASFIDLENEVLKEYHNASAVHTGAELDLLHSLFPENIILLSGMYEGKMIAGAVLYVYKNVVHTQYLAANDKAREIGALDYVINEAIARYQGEKKWFDFGKSTEERGNVLNTGLISQKEGFGGRTVVYKTWELVQN